MHYIQDREGHAWTASIFELVKLVFLCPVNLIRGMVEGKGKGFIRPVQASCFWKHFCSDVTPHCLHFMKLLKLQLKQEQETHNSLPLKFQIQITGTAHDVIAILLYNDT